MNNFELGSKEWLEQFDRDFARVEKEITETQKEVEASFQNRNTSHSHCENDRHFHNEQRRLFMEQMQRDADHALHMHNMNMNNF